MFFFSGSILDNLRWGDKDATDEQCIEACKMACADEFIETFPDKYDTHIEQGGTNVSGGQKQRLCIARALLKKPKVLILDDSTSAVDTATDAKIRASFAKAIPGTTKLIIAQRISSVMDADKIIVMNNGCVDGFDTHENLLKIIKFTAKYMMHRQTAAVISMKEVQLNARTKRTSWTKKPKLKNPESFLPSLWDSFLKITLLHVFL